MKKAIILASFLCNIIFFGLILRRIASAPKATKNNHTADFFTITGNILAGLPKDTTDVLFLGDSQFANWHISEFVNDNRLKNRGINGDGTNGLLKRVYDSVKGRPAKVFIEIGVNDIMAGNPVDSIILNLQKTIDVFKQKSPKTKLYILSVFPTKGPMGTEVSIYSKVNGLNSRYFYLCQKIK